MAQKNKLVEKQKIIERYRKLTLEQQKEQGRMRKSALDPSVMSESQRLDTQSDHSDVSGNVSRQIKTRQKVNGNIYIDQGKFQKALNGLEKMATAKRIIKVLETALTELHQVISCELIQAFIVDNSLNVQGASSVLEKANL